MELKAEMQQLRESLKRCKTALECDLELHGVAYTVDRVRVDPYRVERHTRKIGCDPVKRLLQLCQAVYDAGTSEPGNWASMQKPLVRLSLEILNELGERNQETSEPKETP